MINIIRSVLAIVLVITGLFLAVPGFQRFVELYQATENPVATLRDCLRLFVIIVVVVLITANVIAFSFGRRIQTFSPNQILNEMLFLLFYLAVFIFMILESDSATWKIIAWQMALIAHFYIKSKRADMDASTSNDGCAATEKIETDTHPGNHSD